MKVWHITPYSIYKNLGAEYNACMELIPDNDAACFTDGDSMHLVPDFGTIIHQYANENPNAVLTCRLNRIHPMAKGQLYHVSDDVVECIKAAESLKHIRTATPITGPVSGTLMIIPKHIWKRFPFSEVNTYRPEETNILGCDNEFTNRIRANGIQVLRCDGLFIYHIYRLTQGIENKSHLL